MKRGDIIEIVLNYLEGRCDLATLLKIKPDITDRKVKNIAQFFIYIKKKQASLTEREIRDMLTTVLQELNTR